MRSGLKSKFFVTSLVIEIALGLWKDLTMTNLIRSFASILMWTQIAMAAPVAGTATLDLDEYIALKKQGDVAALTSIEEAQLSGTFQKNLSLRLSGTSMGAAKPEAFLAATHDIVLHACSGNAVLQKTSGQYAIVPFPSFKEAKRFTLTCQVRVKNWNEIRFDLTNVIHAEARVAGMDALNLSEEGESINLVLQPMARVSSHQKAEVSAVGRYAISVRPEENRFVYQLTLHNPNAARTDWDLTLPNSEVVQKVVFSGEYTEISASSYRFKVNPGEALVTLSGVLKNPRFVAPLKSQQFLLLENHPLLQLKVDAKSRRVSPSDTGLNPAFAGARGYVLQNGESLAWEPRKLEVFSALGFSVNSARYLYYIPETGRPVIEGALQIFNQGSPEIPLKIPGTATYVEVNSEPQVLSKDAEGNLLLQLNAGQNRVVFQYQPTREISGGVASVGENLARPDAVLSNVTLTLATPAKWRLGVVRGLNEMVSDLSPDIALLYLLTLVVFFILLQRGFSFSRSQSAVFTGVFAIALLFNETVLLWAWLSYAAVSIIKFLPRIKAKFAKTPVRTLVVGGAIAIVLAMGLNIALEKVSRFSTNMLAKVDDGSYESFAPGAMDEEGGRSDKVLRQKGALPPAAPRGGSAPLGAAPPSEAEPDYQGLPAKIEIPRAGKKVSFSQGLLDEKSTLKVRGLLVSRDVCAWLTLILCAFLGWKLVSRKNQLKSWLLPTQ